MYWVYTEYRDSVWRRRHRFADHQEEHHKSEQNRRLQVDLVAGFHRKEESKEGDEEDEEAGSDEVDDVEEAASAHVDRERHVRVRLHATRVHRLVTLGCYAVNHPLLTVPAARRVLSINQSFINKNLNGASDDSKRDRRRLLTL